ncbi:MerR family DNA-binding transcriptional regulator, partial [Anabaenopsis sp. FSS-46]
MQHITPKEAAKILGVHVSSLRRWENEGKLKAIRTPGGQRRFILEEVEKIGGIPRTITTICYGRVSTHSQQDYLQRQLEHLRTR